jgi:hypothetical protein
MSRVPTRYQPHNANPVYKTTTTEAMTGPQFLPAPGHVMTTPPTMLPARDFDNLGFGPVRFAEAARPGASGLASSSQRMWLLLARGRHVWNEPAPGDPIRLRFATRRLQDGGLEKQLSSHNALCIRSGETRAAFKPLLALSYRTTSPSSKVPECVGGKTTDAGQLEGSGPLLRAQICREAGAGNLHGQDGSGRPGMPLEPGTRRFNANEEAGWYDVSCTVRKHTAKRRRE